MKEDKKSLLYLSYAVMYADGIVQDKENVTFEKIVKYENIPDKELIIFKKDIKKKSLEELRKIGMEGFRNCSRQDQIKILAWIYKMIYADGTVNVREAKFLVDTFKPTDISYSELQEMVKILPEI